VIYLHDFFSNVLNVAREFLSQLNWVDLIAIVIVARTIYIGVRRGLLIEIFKFLGFGAGLYLAVTQYKGWGAVLSERMTWSPDWAGKIAFLAIFILCYGAIVFLRMALEKIATIQINGAWNRIGGALLGFGRGCLWVIVLEVVAVSLTSRYVAQSVRDKSFFGPSLLVGGKLTYQGLNRISSSFVIEGLQEKLQEIPFHPVSQKKES